MKPSSRDAPLHEAIPPSLVDPDLEPLNRPIGGPFLWFTLVVDDLRRCCRFALHGETPTFNPINVLRDTEW